MINLSAIFHSEGSLCCSLARSFINFHTHPSEAAAKLLKYLSFISCSFCSSIRVTLTEQIRARARCFPSSFGENQFFLAVFCCLKVSEWKSTLLFALFLWARHSETTRRWLAVWWRWETFHNPSLLMLWQCAKDIKGNLWYFHISPSSLLLLPSPAKLKWGRISDTTTSLFFASLLPKSVGFRVSSSQTARNESEKN